jgi:hypothetical protein
VHRPCLCERTTCRLCWLYRHNRRYRALWDGASGATFPSPTPRRTLPCVGLGKLVERAGCACPRYDRRQCDWGHGVVVQAVECETCPDYEGDEP